MVIGFRHKGLEDFYRTGSKRGLPAAHAAKLSLILTALDAAEKPEHLNLPAFQLHRLKGKLKGYSSIWVNGNGRVIFKFADLDIERVDYLDDP